ncbi:MAG: sigma-70 family RNA polymerase sigma factor [Cyanobacteria bacterium SZAS-4]|nr:sigma-70 family RNA polymerase sigma factor [Cyanobacteria bacterium SZAS-4]
MKTIWTKEYTNSIKQIIRQIFMAKARNYANLDFDDLEQDTMLRIFMNHNRIPTGVTRTSYIKSIARNCVNDALRVKCRPQNQTQPLEIYDTVENRTLEMLVCDELTVYPQEMADPFLERMVAQQFSKLSPVHQEILLLKAEGLQYKEIAQVQGISIGTARSRLHHAKRICSERLAPLLK